jgi:hypothetical protein
VLAQSSHDHVTANVAAWTPAGVAANAVPVALYAALIGALYLASAHALEAGRRSLDAVPERTEIVREPFSDATVRMASVSIWSIVKSTLSDVMKKLNRWV